MNCPCKYCNIDKGASEWSRGEYISKKYAHEVSRIHQFRSKSRDDGHFRQLLITRAGRCSQGKLSHFIEALEDMGLHDVAGFIKGVMRK